MQIQRVRSFLFYFVLLERLISFVSPKELAKLVAEEKQLKVAFDTVASMVKAMHDSKLPGEYVGCFIQSFSDHLFCAQFR